MGTYVHLNVIVFHMHKAGGTTLCHFFKMQQRRDSIRLAAPMKQNYNCNGPREIHGKACEEEGLQEMYDPEVTKVFFCEYGFKKPREAIPPSNFFGIMLVRHPVNRILSQMVFTWRLKATDLRNDVQRLNSLAVDWIAGNQYVRNKIVRTLSSFGSLSEAVDRMHNFTVIIPTEFLNVGIESIARTLDLWKPKQTRIIRNKKGGGSLSQYINSTVRLMMHKENSLDMVLYEKAIELGRWKEAEQKRHVHKKLRSTDISVNDASVRSSFSSSPSP